jgi:ABC-type glycerol-3-phosphate transport system substrate-binding protein
LKRYRFLFAILLILLFSLSACESLPFDIPWLVPDRPTPTQQPGDPVDETPTPALTDAVEPTPEEITSLTLWVPPELDPESESSAAQLFTDQLQRYSELNDNIAIIVCVKATSGPGGLLDALTATSPAAPDALPDLIALSREDLEVAALKGLIFSMDGLTDIVDNADWYGYAREMALIQGSVFGLPFAGDALALVYRPESLAEIPASWEDLIASEAVLAFPAQSDQVLFQLSLYEGEGGAVQDNQRRPVLELDPLTTVFHFIEDGVTEGLFVETTTQYQTITQVWAAFRDGQTNLAVVWVSDYLQDDAADAALRPLLPMAGGAASMGTGMSWALASPNPERQEMAADLAEFLVEPEFLVDLTYALGYLPTRSSALEGWEDQNLRGTVSQIALMTRLRPSNDILSTLGPIIQTQTQQILQSLIDPAQAAQAALESLEDQ